MRGGRRSRRDSPSSYPQPCVCRLFQMGGTRLPLPTDGWRPHAGLAACGFWIFAAAPSDDGGQVFVRWSNHFDGSSGSADRHPAQPRGHRWASSKSRGLWTDLGSHSYFRLPVLSLQPFRNLPQWAARVTRISVVLGTMVAMTLNLLLNGSPQTSKG